MSNYTPYKCAKIVNEILKERNIERSLPPQMFYNYVSKGYIPSTDKKVAHDELMKWFEGYFNKNILKVTETPNEDNIDENQLELEL